jgi:hypothetical protein
VPLTGSGLFSEYDRGRVIGRKFFRRLSACGESRRRDRRQIDLVSRHDLVAIAERAEVGDGRAGGDGGGIIAGDVANPEGYNASRTGGEG